MIGANRTKESLYWYRTQSALRPADFIFYVNFEYVGMARECEPREIDKYRLAELGKFSRDELESRIRSGFAEPKDKFVKVTAEELQGLRHSCYRNIFELEEIAFSGVDSAYTKEQAEEAMVKIERNYDLIQKLHAMEAEVSM